MFKVTFGPGDTVLEQDSLPTDDDCLYMLDTGEVDIVIAGSGEAANTNQEERKVLTSPPAAAAEFPPSPPPLHIFVIQLSGGGENCKAHTFRVL